MLASWLQRSWKLLVAAVLLGGAALALALILLARPQPYPLAWSLAIVGATSVLAASMILLIWLRLRRRLIRRLLRGARNLSSGDLNTPMPNVGPDELAPLAASLNVIRGRLAAQVRTIERQRGTLATLVNQLREGVIVLRADARVRLMNPAAARLLELPGSPAEYVGKPLHPWLPLEAIRELALYPRHPEADQVRQTKVVVRTAQVARTLRAHIAPLELADEAGAENLAGRLLVLSDITELVRTIQMRTDFVANASHELRTPLSTIRAATETLLALDLRRDADEAQQFLHAIERHSARLEEMVLDLLELSRLESPESVFEIETLRIDELLGVVHARVAEALERTGLRWETRVEPAGAAELRGNARLLRLVLDNLVDNALQFTPRGGRVRVSIRIAQPWAVIAVSDTGCGIPPEEQQRVFERFYQVQRERSGLRRGTGLGLSIVRHALSAMRGEVSVHSKVGAGTTVTISIPQTLADGVPSSPPAVAAAPASDREPSGAYGRAIRQSDA